ncbi:ferritin family protein [Falsibacillus albus]|uniref:Ferritin-like domain-containing protein n=1 Tax=Falsibacillus albus TaxID=2478915 RepID=A0A3L7K2U5_9BACI|nr:ferritin-like domain-containing protein [Falsibacillus albus]RLQ97318.1 ferritin-like domain-containing protein [Falsibacillus albus]
MTFLEKLETAINNEWKAYHFYKELKTKTNNPLYIEFIDEPMQDEKKHFEMFQYLHKLLTGDYFENKEEEVQFTSFKEGVLMALKDELEAAAFYRDMLFEIPNQQAYQPLFVAMTDEMEHATRFSTIYNSLK